MVRHVFMAILLFSTAGLAQDKKAPESVLAGIDIFHSTIPEIIKLYGPPEGVFAAPAPYPVGTKQYRWARLTVTLRVLTEPTPAGDKISAIQIEGDGDGKPISRTGRGLKPGDKADAMRKMYGTEPTGQTTRMEWANGVTLLVRANDKARIDRLELSLGPRP